MNDDPKNGGGAIYGMIYAVSFGAIIILSIYVFIRGVLGW